MYPSETLPAPEQPSIPVQEAQEKYLWPDEYDYTDKYEKGQSKDKAEEVKAEEVKAEEVKAEEKKDEAK